MNIKRFLFCFAGLLNTYFGWGQMADSLWNEQIFYLKYTPLFGTVFAGRQYPNALTFPNSFEFGFAGKLDKSHGHMVNCTILGGSLMADLGVNARQTINYIGLKPGICFLNKRNRKKITFDHLNFALVYSRQYLNNTFLDLYHWSQFTTTKAANKVYIYLDCGHISSYKIDSDRHNFILLFDVGFLLVPDVNSPFEENKKTRIFVPGAGYFPYFCPYVGFGLGWR